MKHYTIEIHEAPPKGALLGYSGIDAENKTDLKKKVTEWNKANPDKYMPLHTAQVIR